MDPYHWKEILATKAGVLGLISGIVALSRGGLSGFKDGLMACGKILWWLLTPLHVVWTNARATRKLTEELRSFRSDRLRDVAEREKIVGTIDRMAQQVAATERTIHQELRFNGGSSIKDVLALLHADFTERKRSVPYPMFICDEFGQNKVISIAYAALHDLGRDEALMDVDWVQFIDSRDTKPYMDSFLAAVKRHASFGGRFRYANPDKGSWSVMGRPILQDKRLKLLYLGVMRPADDRAQELAEELGFDYSEAPF